MNNSADNPDNPADTYDTYDTDEKTLIEIHRDIKNLPEIIYTQEEIDKARDELTLMNHRVFMGTFADNKHNNVITNLIGGVRQLHKLPPIPPIENTQVENPDIYDIIRRQMFSDLSGTGNLISIILEIQAQAQAGYAARGIITTGNAMRKDFKIGDDYTKAPDVVTVHLLGFRLPELKGIKNFCSRIINAEYESGRPFLAEKYSTYFVELPKMPKTKAKLPKEYHTLWDFCHIFKTKMKNLEEEVKMQAITNPSVLELADAAKKTVAPNEFITEEMRFKREIEALGEYLRRGKEEGEKQGEEKLLLLALRNNVPRMIIDKICEDAGITKVRLAKLMRQL
ncbi:MAG: PD-(D/E)XK nuclease family transposase [Defluviitaleaceae bacterium]|nr:PD-(D/E)XK nuclease family transposase [Defluviitaleaceae bacterium]